VPTTFHTASKGISSNPKGNRYSHSKECLTSTNPTRWSKLTVSYNLSCISGNSGVIHADYRGQVKIIPVYHRKIGYEVKIREGILQFMRERLDDQKRIEVDGLDETDRAETGFVHCGTGLELKETQPKICSLALDSNHKFYNSSLLILTNTWASQNGRCYY